MFAWLPLSSREGDELLSCGVGNIGDLMRLLEGVF